MVDRAVTYRLRAEIGQFKAQMAQAGASVRKAAVDMTGATASGEKFRRGLDTLGGRAGKVGLVAAVGLGAATKAAMSWETAWTGVAKTVDGTGAQMRTLEGDLRSLARSMPVTHQEIAATAEAAGQLGVATKDVASFTETMLQLGTATNLTADEAATSIAQFMNVMGTAPGKVDNLGAALVELGNNGASTERDIIQMAQRISGAGKQVGLAESDVLGIANAVASAGIEVEAGGSAISRALTLMAVATKSGGEKLEAFAATAGMSGKEFARAFEDDPARAFAAFTKGLDGVKKSGGDVFSLLKSLGMSDVRISQAMLAMAGSGDMLTESLDLGAEAYKKNTALAKEYSNFADTSASKTKTAWNNIKDAGIEIGDTFLPAVAKGAEGAAKLAGAFADLPDPVRKGATALTAFTAVAGGGIWAFSKLVSGIASTRQMMSDLGVSFKGANKAMLATRVGAGAAGLGLLAVSGHVRKVNTEMGDLTQIAGAAAVGFSVGGPWGAAIGSAVGLTMSLTTATKNLGQAVDGANAAAKGGSLAEMKAGLAVLEAEMDKFGQSTKTNLLDPFFSLKSMKGVYGVLSGETRDAAVAADDLSKKIYEQGDAATSAKIRLQGAFGYAIAEKATASMYDLNGELRKFNALTRAEALDAYRSALLDSADAIRSNGRTLATNTRAGLANRDMLRRLGSAATTAAAEMRPLKGARLLTKARSDIIAAAMQMGATRAEARRLARQVLELDKIKARPTVALAGAERTRNEVSAVKAMLADLNGQTATTYVQTIRKAPIRGGVSELVTRAAGGFDAADRHAPEMTGPGSPVRVWSEPETRGESYIPHANDWRRARAKRITEQTVDLFGGDVTWHAAGSMRRGRRKSKDPLRGARNAFDITEYTFDAVHSELSDFSRDVAKAGGRLGKNFGALSQRIYHSASRFDQLAVSMDDVRSRQDSARSGALGAYASDPFGGDFAAFMTQVSADTNDSNAVMGAIASLAVNGAGADLLAGLSGSSNAALVQQMAGMSAAEIANANHAFQVRAYTSVMQGNQAAGLYEPSVQQIAAQQAQTQAQIQATAAAVEAGARKGTAGGHRKAKTKAKARR